MPTAREWADQIAGFDPRAVESTKEAMIRGSSMSLERGLSFENMLLSRLTKGPRE
jgi:enoyl-CoA hydratase/carnithine racemase